MALSFEHHAATLKLDSDTDRDAMLADALANGWTAKQTRAAVLRLRVASGDYHPPEDDDPEDGLFRAIAQACNRANPAVRRMIVESLEEADFGVIPL
ncbi:MULTISPECIES: hypothetical protein [unclassified Sphingomonas]|uniref:hypothetical protein n=1 Tax=unclassified Sphingomonas TaxID=196159 RepID=UPI00226AF2FF|nr:MULTISPECIES: hypothetical protein [unclassified Sphingomonas]